MSVLGPLRAGAAVALARGDRVELAVLSTDADEFGLPQQMPTLLECDLQGALTVKEIEDAALDQIKKAFEAKVRSLFAAGVRLLGETEAKRIIDTATAETPRKRGRPKGSKHPKDDQQMLSFFDRYAAKCKSAGKAPEWAQAARAWSRAKQKGAARDAADEAELKRVATHMKRLVDKRNATQERRRRTEEQMRRFHDQMRRLVEPTLLETI